MILSGIDNQSVSLKISNYQFPHTTTPDDYDANWLLIYLEVNSKQGYWRTIDPSLLTWDVEELIQWFKDLADNKTPVNNQLEFLEPNLSFQLIKNYDEVKRVRIRFDLESRPESANEDINYFVDCLLTSDELRKAADELSQELSKFPKR